MGTEEVHYLENPPDSLVVSHLGYVSDWRHPLNKISMTIATDLGSVGGSPAHPHPASLSHSRLQWVLVHGLKYHDTVLKGHAVKVMLYFTLPRRSSLRRSCLILFALSFEETTVFSPWRALEKFYKGKLSNFVA